MLELKTTFLCTFELEFHPPRMLGQTPLGQRLIADFIGGRITGPRINGRLLPSGADWLLIGTDGCGRIDVRAVLEMDDSALAYVSYNGRLNIPAELMGPLFDRDKVETIDPSKCYFRSAPTFETSSAKYAWSTRSRQLPLAV